MQIHDWIKPAAAVVLTTALLAGCNTVKGLGQDVQRGGEKVAETAEQTQQKM